MKLATLAAIVADRLDVPASYVEDLAEDAVHNDGNPYRRAAELILLTLAQGRTDWRGWYDTDREAGALQFISGALEEMGTLQLSDLARFAYRSTYAYGGGAVVVTCHCDDGTEILAHTADGNYAPYLGRVMTDARVVSGRQLFMIARDIASHMPAPIERRTFKAEVAR